MCVLQTPRALGAAVRATGDCRVWRRHRAGELLPSLGPGGHRGVPRGPGQAWSSLGLRLSASRLCGRPRDCHSHVSSQQQFNLCTPRGPCAVLGRVRTHRAAAGDPRRALGPGRASGDPEPPSGRHALSRARVTASAVLRGAVILSAGKGV